MDLLFLFFCEAHILDVGGKGESAASVTPFIAINVLFLVTQVRFWSLAPLQKTNLRRWGKRKAPTDRSAGF